MQEDLTCSLGERHCTRGALHADTDIDLLNYKRKTEICNSDRRLTRVRDISRNQDYYEEKNSSCIAPNVETIPKILSLEHQREYCSVCRCLEETSISETETTIESIEREESPPPTKSEHCSWKSVEDGRHRIFSSHIKERSSCVFPFKATPSGNLKVVPKQVVFESKKVSVLVADPGCTKINVKTELEEPKKLAKSMDGTHCSCLTVTTKSQKDDSTHESDLHSEQYLQSLGYGKTEPIDWSKVLLPQKSDLVGLLLHRIVNCIQPDTILHLGNKKFPCHLLVLQCYSTYFGNYTCGEYKLPEGKVTPSAFASIYKWMIYPHTDSYHLLQRDNILEVLNAAHFLGIKELEDQCWSFISNEELFSEDKAFILYLQAKKMGNSKVMELMASRIMQFFLILVSSRDFLELSLDEVCFLLSSSYIYVHSEIEVFMSAVRWLMSDWDYRRKHVFDVMKCVRFGLIAPWQLVDIRRNPENPEFMEVTSFPDVQQMIEDGLAYAIIKYWYGNQTEDYYHWIDLLGLEEPSSRNWYGDPKNYVTYREFLKDLEGYRQQKILERKSRQKEHQSHASQSKPAVNANNKADKPTPESIHNFLPPAVTSEQPQKEAEVQETKSMPSVEEFLVQRKTNVTDESENCTVCKAEEHLNECSTAAPEMQSEKEKIKYSVPARVLEFETILSQKNPKQDLKASALNNNRQESQKFKNSDKYFPQNNVVMQASLTTTSIPSQQSSNSRFSKTELTLSSSVSRELINAQQVANALGPVSKNYLTDTSLFFADRESVLLFGGVGPQSSNSEPSNTGKDIYRYHPLDDSWEQVGEMPEPRHHHGVAFLKGHIYIAGGVDPRKTDKEGKSLVTNTLWSIDPVSRKWYRETSMLTARQNFGLVVCSGKLYAIGGQDANGRILSSVERFNPTTGVWEYVKSLEVGRMGVAVAKYQHYIWVAGGMSAIRKAPVSRSVDCYDTRHDVWIPNTPLRIPRCFSCLFVRNDKLYLVGGAGGFAKEVHNIHSLAAIDVWDSENKEWCLLAEMANRRHAHSIAYLDSQMLIIGGVTTDTLTVLTSVERYCCKSNKWLQGVCSVPASLSGHGCVTLPPASLM